MACRRQSRPNEVRLQKYLADCGLGSRRACESLIAGGAVSVDGEIIAEQGRRVVPGCDVIRVRGEVVEPQAILHLALNKPRDVLCTSSDPGGRRTVHDLLPPMSSRVYTVGRLDRDSEGLIIVTNDGDLAARLTHPRHHVPKRYRVWIGRRLAGGERKALLAGVESRGEILRASGVGEVGHEKRGWCYEVTLEEGKNRQLRRMFEALGHAVQRLVRTEIGPLSLGGLARGAYRALTDEEVRALKKAAGIEA